jgi:hypothetical protein
VIESKDARMRDTVPNWIRFTADQISFLLHTDASGPSEMVEWCVVTCSGDTSKLAALLKESLVLTTGQDRHYYIKGFICNGSAKYARVFIEVQPIVKTVLLRCLIQRFLTPMEIITFPPDQQASALAFVASVEDGKVSEGGNLSLVGGGNAGSTPLKTFTLYDLSVWDCIVLEPQSMHWSMTERDYDLHRLRMGLSSARMQVELKEKDIACMDQRCVRMIGALERMTAERDGLQQAMCDMLKEKDACIAQLVAHLDSV